MVEERELYLQRQTNSIVYDNNNNNNTRIYRAP